MFSFVFSVTRRIESVSLQTLQILTDRIQSMHDRIMKSAAGSFRNRRRGRILILILLMASCFLIAFVGFSYHVYETVDRFSQNEILQSSLLIKNQSLALPIILLQLDSHRRDKKTHVEMKFEAFLDNEELPKWAFREGHYFNQHLFHANVVNMDLIGDNFTMEDAKFAVILKSLHFTKTNQIKSTIKITKVS